MLNKIFKMAILEDDLLVSETIKGEALPYLKDISFDIDIFTKVNALYESLLAGNEYEVIYCDIDMMDKDYFKLFKYCRRSGLGEETDIILITKQIEINGKIANLMLKGVVSKPLKEFEMKRSVKNILLPRIKEYKIIFIESSGRIVKLRHSDILYIKADLKRINIHTLKENYAIYFKISSMIDVLGGSFERIHNSYIVNKEHITYRTKDYVILDNGLKINIGNKYSKQSSL